MEGVFRSVDLVIGSAGEVCFGQVALDETGPFQIGIMKIGTGQVGPSKSRECARHPVKLVD